MPRLLTIENINSRIKDRDITLIGATTENPSFEVISALLSRCQIYILESLSNKELDILLQKEINVEAERIGKEIFS